MPSVVEAVISSYNQLALHAYQVLTGYTSTPLTEHLRKLGKSPAFFRRFYLSPLGDETWVEKDMRRGEPQTFWVLARLRELGNRCLSRFIAPWPTRRKVAFAALLIVIGMCALPRIVRYARDSAFVSRVLDQSRHSPPLRAETQRSVFSTTTIPEYPKIRGHSHPTSAGDRNAATTFCKNFMQNLGYTPYYYQRSRADERHSREGSRSYYWAKDFTAAAKPYRPGPHDGLCIVDVDYYADMPSILIENFGRPIVLYTLSITEAGATGGDYAYSFDDENQITYRVAGGGVYKHEVWDWGKETLTITKTFPWPKTCLYLIDRREMGQHHMLVSLSPIASWSGVPALIARWSAAGSVLERLAPAHDGFVRVNTLTANGEFVSIAPVNSSASATITVRNYVALETIARRSKTPITLPQVMALSDVTDEKECKRQSTIILDYMRSTTRHPGVTSYPVDASVRSYDFELPTYDPSTRSSLEPFMSPLVHACFTPYRNASAERSAINGRITSIQHKTELPLSPFLEQCMDEFVELIFDGHVLEPVEFDDVYEKQSRPTQRATLDRSMWESAKRIMKTFVKAEAYENPKDPRVITTINGPDKRDYSTYVYPISEHLKNHCPWYAFGKTPLEISQRVADICSNANEVVFSDFSRWDGRKSSCFRRLDEKLVTKAYSPRHCEKATELARSQYLKKGVGRYGTFFDTLWSQSSGSPDTSSFNTVDDAFTAYATFRRMRIPGTSKFYHPEAAYSMLGIYGGDDGLTANIDPALFRDTASALGAKMEAESVVRGKFGVNFLARYYSPNVWTGALDSCCSLHRQLSKFHATVRLPPTITAESKLIEKARAFYLTDKNTPIIGPFVSLVVALSLSMDQTDHQSIWNAQWDTPNQYPNENTEDWMEHVVACDIPEFDREAFDNWLASVRTLSDCLSPPLCMEPRPVETKLPVVVDEDVIMPKTDSTTPVTTPDAPAAAATIKAPPQQAERQDDETTNTAARERLPKKKRSRRGTRGKKGLTSSN